MKKEELRNSSIEQLEKRRKGQNMLFGFSIGLGIMLLIACAAEYHRVGEANWAMITIGICTIGGGASAYEVLKKIREELKSRS